LEALSALSAVQPPHPADKTSIDPLNLKLVMDVELNVSLRFGQRQLPLREVLELASGSVIELDRQVDDPVELLLDGKVIARGEAVIVDGNYGLRIIEIPQPIASHFI
jgi:flagellar motor switch protein FliN/FliY